MPDRMKELSLRQLDQRLQELNLPKKTDRPDKGWIHKIREALGMTLAQLGQRIGVSQPTVSEYEKREQKGTITLNSLKKAADGLGCELVYALAPKGESLREFRKQKARKAAETFVGSTSHSMSLEDQDVSEEEKEQQIEELTRELLDEWDNTIWEVGGSIWEKDESGNGST